MGIEPLSTFEEINKKYKRLIKKTHPDVAENCKKSTDVNKAYNIIKDYIKNYKFTFSEDEIQKQYPEEFLKKFKV